ncbi:hypothetical protein CMI42_00120 [Candidatus Pacearchaeota archaeon]|nr:hypothetical protein [Candidatus Pacearchaeota archaeon]|tara:strand:+ start:333 stop:536 length:204 start_codon:yes stop_codon:yes gene_type:complete
METQISDEEIVDQLRKIEETMVTKEELKQVMETIAVLSNSDTLDQIKKSEEDVREGRVHKINSVLDI